MVKSHITVITAALAMSVLAGNALAAKKCNIVGSFTDSLGSTGQFTSEKKGSVSNSNVCAATYALKVTKLSETVIDIAGKAKGCGALTGDFTFQNGGCDVASGTITIAGLGTFNDTVTRSGKVVARARTDNTALTAGIK
jgi:hypothetical protein